MARLTALTGLALAVVTLSVLAVSPAPAVAQGLVANDDFANAEPLASNGAVTSGDTTLATAEAGEPEHYPGTPPDGSLWYRWTAPADGVAVVDLCDSDFLRVMAAYTGTSVAALDNVARIDQCSGNFAVEQGLTYSLAVDGRFGQRGTFTLALSFYGRPGNDDFGDAEVLSGASADTTGQNFGASAQTGAGEPNHAGGDGTGASIWYRWTPSVSGVARLDLCDSSIVSVVAAPYTGAGVGALTPVPVLGGAGTCKVDFAVTSGVPYSIAVDGKFGERGTVALHLRFHEPPANDNFAAATVLSGSSTSGSVNTTAAGVEALEPQHFAVTDTDATAWYRWTAPSTGTVRFDACGTSEFSPVFAAYTGSALGSLTKIGSTGLCRLHFRVTSGVEYRIAIDGFSGGRGQIDFAVDLIATPANDDLASAQALPAGGGGVDADNIGATGQASEPAHVTGQPNDRSSVWYSWTPSSSGTARVDVCTAEIDARLGIYTGSSFPPATTIDQGFCRSYFPVTAGTTYRIAVEGTVASAENPGDRGTFHLSAEILTPPANDNFASAEVLTLGPDNKVTTSGSNIAATSQVGEPHHMTNQTETGASVWYTFTAPPTVGASIRIDRCVGGASFNGAIAVYTGSAVNGLSPVMISGAPAKTTACRLIVPSLSAGQVYRIAIDGVSRDRGDFTLRVGHYTTAANDLFANATNLGSEAATASSHNIVTTAKESGEPGAHGGARSIWFRWTPTVSGEASVRLCGSDFDTYMAVYVQNYPIAGTPTLGGLAKIDENDDGGVGCGVASRIDFTATTAPNPATTIRTYWFAVDGYDGAQGEVELELFWEPDPPPDTTAPVVSITGGPAQNASVNTTTPQFSFTADESPAFFECSVDSTTVYSDCDSPYTLPVQPQGLHVFRVRASDFADNVSSVVSRSFTVDTVAPSLTLGSNPPFNTASPLFTFSSTDPAATFECQIDTGSFNPCVSGAGVGPMADGSHTVTFRATDPAGNLSATQSRSFTVDAAEPDTTITAGPQGPTNTAAPSFSFTSNEPGTFECRLDGGAWGACTTPRTYSSLSQDVHTFDVRARDVAGNYDSSPASRTFTVDTVAPDTTIDTGPAQGSVQASASASFTFSSPDPAATFQCRLDGAAYAACTSPQNLSSLGEGSHTFLVRALDPAGNLDSTPAMRTFSVDTTSPDTAIDSGPADGSLITSASPQLTFSSPDATATFECRLDSSETGAWTACTSPRTLSSLSEGAHTFGVRAKDPAGNTDQTPASRTFTVDTIAPQTTIESGPTQGSTIAATTAQVGFSSDDPAASFQCRLDGSGPVGWQTCTTPRQLSSLAEGSHTFEVRAVDVAGNPDDSPSSRTFTVDTIAPQTTIESGPTQGSTIATTTAQVGFSSDDPAGTFECRLDSSAPEAWTACTSPHELTGLAEGAHTFQVRGIDQAGNTDATPASRSWSVDTVPPDTTITSGPSEGQTLTASGVVFGFSSSEPGSAFECKLDAGSFTPCTSPAVYVAMAEGAHTFTVRAVDPAGNPDPSPATRSFTLQAPPPDVAAPVSQHQIAPAAPDGPAGWYVTVPAVTLSCADEPGGSGVALIEFRFDGGSWQTYSSPLAPPQGEHLIEYRCTDLAGNVETPLHELEVSVDTTAPDTTVDSGPAGPTSNASPSFTFSSNEASVTFQCRLDLGDWSSCTSPQELASLSDGAHTFEVRAMDPAGNTDQTPASRTFTVDTIAPDTSIDAGPAQGSTLTSAGATFSFSSAEATATFECRLDGSGAGGWSACTSPRDLTSLGEGAHTFEVRAVDAAGNPDDSPSSRTFTVDTVAPQTTIESGPTQGSTITTTTAQVGFSSGDPAATFQCRLDGSGPGGWVGCTSPLELTGLAEGAHTFQVRGIDPAGNTDATPASRTFTVDTVVPETVIEGGPAQGSTIATNSPEFVFDSDDPAATFACSLDGSEFEACSSPHTLTGLADGEHTFRVRAADGAGNTDATPAARTFDVNATPPDTTITSGPDGLTSSVAPAFGFSSGDSEASFECRVDDGNWNGCASPHTTAVLGDGAHTFEVRAVDTVGNVDLTPAARTFTIDSAPPNTTIKGGPRQNSSQTSRTAKFKLSASEPGSRFQCKLDRGGWKSCSSPKTLNRLSFGKHTLLVRAVDAAGNADPTPAKRSWKVIKPRR